MHCEGYNRMSSTTLAVQLAVYEPVVLISTTSKSPKKPVDSPKMDYNHSGREPATNLIEWQMRQRSASGHTGRDVRGSRVG